MYKVTYESEIISNKNSTVKKKTKKNVKDMWQSFDNENIVEEKNLECLFTNNVNKDMCEYCNLILMINDDGFMCCPNRSCGIIYKDIVDHSAEWRYYGADDNQNGDPTRCGMPINPLLKESSFGCKVLLGYSNNYEMQKIRRYTEWQSMPYKEKSLYDEFQRITIISQNSGIPKIIIDDAIRYHKKISETKTFRGINRDGIIAASIYIACRVNDYFRTAKEIATIFNLDNTSATKGCKNAISIINELENDLDNDNKMILNETTPIIFIERYCSKLSINNELTKLCKFIAKRIDDNNLIPENTPHSIAAGIVYFIGNMCNLNITKKAVSLISKISEVTINKCYKKLELLQNDLIPKVIIEKYK